MHIFPHLKISWLIASWQLSYRPAGLLYYHTACANEGRLYVSTKRGEIMWRGMIDLLPGGAGPAIREVGLQRRPFLLPTNICCNIGFAHRVETTKSDDSLVVLGSEILRPLYRPEGFVITNTCGCTILPRSEVMIMVTTEETFSIQAWYGNVCIAKLNTGLKFNQFQTLDCAKDGTLYGLVNDNIYIWKLVWLIAYTYYAGSCLWWFGVEHTNMFYTNDYSLV